MNSVDNMIGRIIAGNVAESVELRLLKQKMYAFVENLTQDDTMIVRFEELFNCILRVAQTDSKYEEFIAGVDFVNSEL